MAGERKRVEMKGVQRDLCDLNAEANNGQYGPLNASTMSWDAHPMFRGRYLLSNATLSASLWKHM